MQAVLMSCNRSFTLRTVYGSIPFEANQERLVSPQMVPFALQAGVLPVDNEAILFEPEPKVTTEPTDSGTRAALIAKAIEAIYEANDIDEFAANKPKVTAVAKRTGLKKVSALEIKEHLTQRNQRLLDAQMEATKALKTGSAPIADGKESDPPDDEM